MCTKWLENYSQNREKLAELVKQALETPISQIL